MPDPKYIQFHKDMQALGKQLWKEQQEALSREELPVGSSGSALLPTVASGEATRDGTETENGPTIP